MKLKACRCGFKAKVRKWRDWTAWKYEAECEAGHRGGVRYTEKEAASAWNRAQNRKAVRP